MLRPGHILSVLKKMLFTFNFVIVQAHERVSLVEEKEFFTSYFQLHKRENGSGNCKSFPRNVQSLQWTQRGLCWGGQKYKCILNLNYVKAKDQIVIDELSTHTDESRKELIHPYKVYTKNDPYLGALHELYSVTINCPKCVHNLHLDTLRPEPKLCAEGQSRWQLGGSLHNSHEVCHHWAHHYCYTS